MDKSQSGEVDHSQSPSDESPARKNDSESEIPKRLGKRARTAYFIFQDEKRAQLRDQVGYMLSHYVDPPY